MSVLSSSVGGAPSGNLDYGLGLESAATSGVVIVAANLRQHDREHEVAEEDKSGSSSPPVATTTITAITAATARAPRKMSWSRFIGLRPIGPAQA